MAAAGESLESWLNKATAPSNRQEEWEYVMAFCDQINKELEGPQISVRLLVHKIHSPQEWEALQALTVLEACMKNCGQRFQNEVGRFRFLNELIKVISPKYLGDNVSEKVKSKVIKMIYSWTIYLPEETKICEAYQMLKTQGIVLADPEIPSDATLVPSSSERPKNPVFNDEQKSKKLAELLKSKKHSDLQEANQLIKNMVKEDEVRSQKVSKQSSTLEAVNNRVKLLNEMLTYFSPGASADVDKDLIRELYSDCDKLRQTVCQLATETDDDDTYLGDILQANDDLSNVLNSYKKIMEGTTSNGETKTLSGTSFTAQSESLIDLMDVDDTIFSQLGKPPVTSPASSHVDLLCGPIVAEAESGTTSASFSMLDEELLSLGPAFCAIPPSVFGSVFPSAPPAAFMLQQPPDGPVSSSTVPAHSTGKSPPTTINVTASQVSSAAQSSKSEPASTGDILQDVALLDFSSPKSLPKAHFDNTQAKRDDPCSPANPMCQSGVPVATNCPPARCHDENALLHSHNPFVTKNRTNSAGGEETSFANVFVPLEAVRPSKLCPITAYDKSGVRVLLHFSSDCPPGCPDVLVIVASVLNTSPLPVCDFVLQAAVPKTMKVRLQPPSGTQLASFNPIAPPATISQVILLSNPHKEKVRMRFKLTFTLGEQHYEDVGEVNDFPPPDRWGSL
ncbi:ADP-ribosylation factor-binding protein GGA3a isoform X1 [Nerophis ophidion]|uniref:ADP-ribosylation factor-binding protein GGA3a isoform X1 n=3 Tax=Nerophis ophidion TaxID=159077 RepID=UPI002AE029BE|nr:ADP-ribosylation factor-binding protein GGA3a isoform X1 [Nerophis ophidion]